MLIQRTNPKGVDAAIKLLQGTVYFRLLAAWGIEATPDLYTSFDRIYKNQRDGLFVPEWYDADGEYKEVAFDDLAAYSFFGIGDKVDCSGPMNSVDAYLVFRVNLAVIKPAAPHRADEEVRLDVQHSIGTGMYGFELVSVETGVKNAFKEYGKWIEQNQYTDMHPWHVFRLNFKLMYNTKNC